MQPPAVQPPAASAPRVLLAGWLLAGWLLAGWLLAACQSTPKYADTLREVFRLQDQRVLDLQPLARRVRHKDPRVRRGVVRALSAMRDPKAVRPLLTATRDQDRTVSLAAIFALGLQPGPDRWRHLEPLADPADPERCAAVLASLRSADRSAVRPVAALVVTDDARVAGLAALALGRLLGDRLRQRESQIPPQLATLARGVLATSLSRTNNHRAHWRMVYALAHLVLPEARDVLLPIASGRHFGRWSRLFAIRGLAGLPPDGQTREALLRLLDETDWMLVYEACNALARPPRGRRAPIYSDQRVAKALLDLRGHATTNVRVVATLLLGGLEEHRTLILSRLSAGEQPGGVSEHAAHLEVIGRLGGPAALRILRESMAHRDWRLRAATARGLSHLPATTALPLLAQLVGDRDVRVRAAVFEGLPRLKGDRRAIDLAIAGLGTRELAAREILATVAPQIGDPQLIPALIRAYEDSPGLTFAEPRKLMVRAIAELDSADSRTRRLLRAALSDPAFVVRREASSQLGKLNIAAPFHKNREGLITLLPGRDFDWSFLEPDSRPIVRMTTTRGTLEITLFPDKAPIHCHNWIRLIETGSYRGRLFHRVVPNFVVQGGDHRGDGFGSRAYHGGQIRDEINDVPYLAGTVGMPKTADDDTGGDQIFISSVPTPHLDRRYTVFGRVTRGIQALDRIEIGDRITAISVRRR